MSKRLTLAICSALLLATFGCKSEETSSKDASKMSESMQGKGYGKMPDDTRRQMEEAMRRNAPRGAGAPPGPATR